MSSLIHKRLARHVLRGALLLSAAAALGACSSESDTDLSTMFDIAGSFVHSETTSVTLDQASSIRFATTGFRIGDGSEALGILTTDSGGLLWVVGTTASFVTRDGRLVRTAGLEHNLDRLALDPTNTFSPYAIANGTPADTTWAADYNDKNVFSAPVACHAQAVGPEDVSILGKPIHTIRVDENCHSNVMHWSFRNSYWVSATSGLVWRSTQHVHPNIDAITTELFRPPDTGPR